MHKNLSIITFCAILSITTLQTNFAMQQTTIVDPQEGSLLCQLPQNILYLIAESLEKSEMTEATTYRPSGWKYINFSGRTCRLLDQRMTIPGKPIKIVFPHIDKPDTAYLTQCFHVLKRMADRDGYNPITIIFFWFQFETCMSAVQQFFDNCARTPICAKVKILNLEGCNMTTLPSGITKMQELEDLNLAGNSVGNCTQQIALLRRLKKLNLSRTKLEKLDPSIIHLQNLKILKLNDNKLSDDVLPLITQLKNLEELGLFYSGVTYRGIINNFKNWPTPLSMTFPISFKESEAIDENTRLLFIEMISTTSNIEFFLPE